MTAPFFHCNPISNYLPLPPWRKYLDHEYLDIVQETYELAKTNWGTPTATADIYYQAQNEVKPITYSADDISCYQARDKMKPITHFGEQQLDRYRLAGSHKNGWTIRSHVMVDTYYPAQDDVKLATRWKREWGRNRPLDETIRHLRVLIGYHYNPHTEIIPPQPNCYPGIAELQNLAKDDDIVILESSKEHFLEFFSSLRPSNAAETQVTPYGNLRAVWDDDDGNHIGLQFFGEDTLNCVIFKGPKDSPSRIYEAKRGGMNLVMERIRHHELEHLMGI